MLSPGWTALAAASCFLLGANALSAHSPQDLFAFPRYSVVLKQEGVLNETVSTLIEQHKNEVRAVSYSILARTCDDQSSHRHSRATNTAHLTRALCISCARPLAKPSCARFQKPTMAVPGAHNDAKSISSSDKLRTSVASSGGWHCSSP